MICFKKIVLLAKNYLRSIYHISTINFLSDKISSSSVKVLFFHLPDARLSQLSLSLLFEEFERNYCLREIICFKQSFVSAFSIFGRVCYRDSYDILVILRLVPKFASTNYRRWLSKQKITLEFIIKKYLNGFNRNLL